MEAGKLQVKVSVSYNHAFALVKKVDDVIKKHQDVFSRIMSDEDAAAIEEALEELRQGLQSERC